MPEATPTPPAARPWLVRIPEIFEPVAAEVLRSFGAAKNTRIGQDYYLIETATPEAIRQSDVAKFCSWNLPLQHVWRCNTQEVGGFIEKAAKTIAFKFSQKLPQGIFMGQINPGSPDKYFKSLASNLRGRTLQLFPKMAVGNVEEQDPTAPTLYCLVGKEGLFCGVQSPRQCNGLYPGGSKFVSKDSPDTISRAGAKIAEALHYLLMYRPALPPGNHWLELGACPGGMTSELLARQQKVTAIDRAPLDKRLNGAAGLKFIRADVATFEPRRDAQFDAILSDMNGAPEESMEQVLRLSQWLKSPGLVVFTLKTPRVDTIAEPIGWFRKILKMAEEGGLKLIAQTHLTSNRHEFTLFFEKPDYEGDALPE